MRLLQGNVVLTLYTVGVREIVATSSGRLDISLASSGAVLTRSIAKRLIEDGAVTVNGKTVTRPAARIAAGDTIALRQDPSAAPSHRLPSSARRLSVLFEDDDCMVLDKPAGLAVHPGSGMAPDQETVLSILSGMFADRGIPFAPSDVLVHRLDQDTTGCLLIAKNASAHRALQRQFQDRTVSKRYLALVVGTPLHVRAMIDASIGRHAGDRTKMSVLGASKSRQARTSYETVGSGGGASLLLLTLHTGRTHQVRVHLRGIGHPVLGDDKYGSPASRDLSHRLGVDSICLHAASLAFTSPSGNAVQVRSSIPAAFAGTLKQTGIAPPKP